MKRPRHRMAICALLIALTAPLRLSAQATAGRGPGRAGAAGVGPGGGLSPYATLPAWPAELFSAALWTGSSGRSTILQASFFGRPAWATFPAQPR